MANELTLFQRYGVVYAGVGARKTPEGILLVMAEFSKIMSARKATLRSGGAFGADSAFESGSGFRKEIFLPHRFFNRNHSDRYSICESAYEIAQSVHPNWSYCDAFSRNAHARNVYQVLGQDLKSPSSFVMCWTMDGATNEAECCNAGGTRTAIVLAARHGIKVFNLANEAHLNLIKNFLKAHKFSALKGRV